MTDSGAGNLIDTASSGVEELAKAATSTVDQSGPAGALVQPVVGALRNVWEGYFGSPVPPGGTNWDAYTHEQLYQMLWQNADVGDVSSVAAEWGRHSSELTEHGNALRKQRSALGANWSGQAAEPAAKRLGELGDRTAGIAGRASTVQRAGQNAGDALAIARNTMPKPPGDPAGAVVTGALAGAGAGAVIGGMVGAGAGGVGAGPGAVMGAAIGAVAGGGASLFLASVAAAEQKAEAVHVMQRYESSLRDSSQDIALAGAAGAGADGAGDQATSAAGYLGAGTAGVGGLAGADGVAGRGVPWGQLAGADPLERGLATGLRTAGGAMDSAVMARSGAMSQLAARAGGSGMTPGAGAHGHEEEDEEHVNRMPTIDHRLFAVDQPTSTPVIGL